MASFIYAETKHRWNVVLIQHFATRPNIKRHFVGSAEKKMNEWMNEQTAILTKRNDGGYLVAADIVRESTGNTASYWQKWPHSSTKSADTNPTFEINAMQSYKTVATLRVVSVQLKICTHDCSDKRICMSLQSMCTISKHMDQHQIKATSNQIFVDTLKAHFHYW